MNRNIKTLFLLLLCAALISSCALGCAEPAYQAGTYTATAYGMGGKYPITMTFSDDEILSIDASQNQETLMLGTEAVRILSERILENQSLDLDAVTAATVSSYAFIRGVEDCVKQAGGDIEALKAKEIKVDTYADKPHEADVIVVGGGLAGLSAASTAVKNGASVIMLEQRGFMGGHSVLAAGTLLLGATDLLAELGHEDSVEAFEAWMNEYGKGAKDPVQTRMVAERAQDAYDFIIGMNGAVDTTKAYITEGTYRGIALSPNIGKAFSDMADKMVELGVDVRYNTRAYDIIVDENGAAVGVKATDYDGNETEYYGKNIVLATGGYAGNRDMLLKYWGDKYKNLCYGGLVGTDAVMMLAAMNHGADSVDLDNPHLDACAELNTGITITAALSTKGGAITVRQSTSQRIANESAAHAEDLAEAMLEIGDPHYIIIYDDTAFEVSSAVSYKANFYNNSGLVRKYETLEDLAAAYDLDADVLRKTIDDYNAGVRGELADPFGRTYYHKEISAPFYATKVNNGVTTTTGGLKVNENMQVVKTDGTPFENLYAAGEVTGGFRINYISGSSLSHSVIGGIVAAEAIAAE